MLERFHKHITIHFPSLLKTPFLLACSGGVDSVVLAYLCSALELDFSLAHCNFKLRGTESDKDEEFVKNLAKKLNIKNYSTHFDTSDYVSKNKVSVQMAARELRYNWFADLIEKERYEIVVTAHQADDNLETFLINLSRGTGINGLTGIPTRTKTILRPLLPFSREEILAYAKTNKIEWREDTSNAETKYLRNKIRHHIVPHLKELHPTFLDNFKRTTSHLTNTAVIAQHNIDQIQQKLFRQEGDTMKISITEIKELKPVNAYLYPLFCNYGFTEWQDVEGLLTAMSGKEVLSKTHRLLRDREYLLLQPINVSEKQVYQIQKGKEIIDTPISLRFTDVVIIEKTPNNTIFIDKDLLKYPLSIRKWEEGDVLYPFGMKGKKKLSKFYKDEKMDVFSKEGQWLLCADNKIVWVIGKRADARFSVTEKTRNILRIDLLCE